jgi:hypothetical protein
MASAARPLWWVMLAHIARTVLVGTVAALAAAPTAQLLRVQGAEDAGRPAAIVAQVTPSPEPTPTPTPTAAPTASATPTPSATATPTPTPTTTPSPTVKPTPSAKPTVKPTAKPSAPATAKDPLWEKVVWACLADTAADGESCFRAIAATGISLADLEAKVLGRLDELKRRQASRGELETLLQKCVTSEGIESDACMRAWRLSGLSLEEFRATVLKKMQPQKPQVTKPAEFETWLQLCIASKELYGQECYRAWEISGLASEDFDRKLKSIWGSGR